MRVPLEGSFVCKPWVAGEGKGRVRTLCEDVERAGRGRTDRAKESFCHEENIPIKLSEHCSLATRIVSQE